MSRRLVPSRKSIRISLPPPARHIPLALYAVNMNTVKSKIKRDIHATMAPERSYELGLETETGAPTKSKSVSVEGVRYVSAMSVCDRARKNEPGNRWRKRLASNRVHNTCLVSGPRPLQQTVQRVAWL